MGGALDGCLREPGEMHLAGPRENWGVEGYQAMGIGGGAYFTEIL